MSDTILELKGVTKRFYNNVVLNNIDLKLEKGEIHAITGKNGAGKSTLVKILAGLYPIDSGSVIFENNEVNIKRPIDSIKLGISVLQQDPYLFNNLTVAENILANYLPVKNKFRIIDKNKMNSETKRVLDFFEFPIRSDVTVDTLNLAQKRMVEITRVLYRDAKIIIMDEPTESLSEIETKELFKYLKCLKSKGISIIYISQRFEEVVKLADRITILRDGNVSGSISADSMDFKALVRMMWGECLSDRYPKITVKHGREIFAVENLEGDNYLDNVTFSVAKGEIVGITGLVGSGRTKLARLIFGLEQMRNGKIYIDRLEATIKSPKDAIDLGIAYVTENRFEEGVFENLSLLDNAFSVKNQEDGQFLFDAAKKNKILKRYMEKININIGLPKRKIIELSGGKQQKVMLLRWFLVASRIIIFDEPTRGVDIASKVDIYNLMNDLVRKEAGIILISSDIEELIGMCDRIMIMRNGSIVADLTKKEFDYGNIYNHLSGN